MPIIGFLLRVTLLVDGKTDRKNNSKDSRNKYSNDAEKYKEVSSFKPTSFARNYILRWIWLNGYCCGRGGIFYDLVQNLVPGVTYYQKYIDTTNLTFFTPTEYFSSPTTITIQPDPSQDPGIVSDNSCWFQTRHILILLCIITVFIPGIFTIVFPICFAFHQKSYPKTYDGLRIIYTVMGWITWFLQLVPLIIGILIYQNVHFDLLLPFCLVLPFIITSILSLSFCIMGSILMGGESENYTKY